MVKLGYDNVLIDVMSFRVEDKFYMRRMFKYSSELDANTVLEFCRRLTDVITDVMTFCVTFTVLQNLFFLRVFRKVVELFYYVLCYLNYMLTWLIG